jgi:hypothetical protein
MGVKQAAGIGCNPSGALLLAVCGQGGDGLRNSGISGIAGPSRSPVP